MKFVVKQAAHEYDIPIATVRTYPVRSHDMIYLQDYAQTIPGNPLASYTFLDGYPSITGILGSPHNLGPVELTDEYYYDHSKGVIEPLWYLHSTTRAYFNKNSVTKVARSTVRAYHHDKDAVVALRPTTSDFVIVQDSISVSYRVSGPGSWLPLSSSAYYINYGDGTVRVTLPDPTQSYDIQIEALLVSVDIEVASPGGSVFRAILHDLRVGPHEPGYYSLALLSSGREPMTVSYRTRSTSTDMGEFSESTVACTLYNEVRGIDFDAMTALDSHDLRVFTQERSNSLWWIKTMGRHPSHRYSFRPRRTTSSIISLREPKARTHDEGWYLGITPGILEEGDTIFDLGSHIPSMVTCIEKARYVDNRTISVNNRDIVGPVGISGEVPMIRITRQDGVVIPAVGFDRESGTISLGNVISVNDIITAEYTHMSDSTPYSYLDLNPLLSQFSDGIFEIVDVCLAFFLIPSPYAYGMSSVCFVSLPRYVGVGSLSYSHDDVYNLANSAVIEDRRSFRASIPLLPRELYETTEGLDVPLRVLGIVFVTDPLDVDGYMVEDSRRFGGGLKVDHDNCYDVSLFDGERVSLEPSLVFEIPRSIYDDLRSRMLIWSPEVVGSDNPEDIVDQYVLEFIRSKVQKFSMLGTVQEIRIGS